MFLILIFFLILIRLQKTIPRNTGLCLMLFGLRLHLKAEILGRFPSADDGEREMQNIREMGCDNHYFSDKISAMKHDERTWFVAVLEIPPVVDAITAVRVQIVKDAKAKK